MIYDILPSFIFFAALGGLIYVVSRVVIRMKREDLSESLAAAAHDAPTRATSVLSSLTGLGSESAADLTALLRPTHKGVRAITGGMGGIFSFFKSSSVSISNQAANLKERSPVVINKAKDLSSKLAKSARSLLEKRPKFSIAPIKKVTGITTIATNVVPVSASAVVSEAKAKIVTRVVASSAPKVSIVPAEVPRALADKTASAATHIKTAVLPPAPPVTTSPQPVPIPAVPAPPAVTEPARGLFMSGSRLRRQREVVASIVEQAQELFTIDEYKAAEELLVPYIMSNPKDTAAYMLLGKIALKQESWDEALEIYEQMSRWQPPVKGACAGIGFAAYRLGDFTRALQMLQRSLNEDPTNREVLQTLLGLAQKMDNRGLQSSIKEQLEGLDIAPLATQERERVRV